MFVRKTRRTYRITLFFFKAFSQSCKTLKSFLAKQGQITLRAVCSVYILLCVVSGSVSVAMFRIMVHWDYMYVLVTAVRRM